MERYCRSLGSDGGSVDGGPLDGGSPDGGGDGGANCANACAQLQCGSAASGCFCGACISGDVCDAGRCSPDLEFCTPVDGGEVKWCWEHPLPQGNTLRGIWAPSDGGFTWAVGDHGTLLRFNGSVWSQAQSGVTEDLRAVHGSAPDDVWAVGDNGTALHFDGRAWSLRRALTEQWLAVYALARDEVHVVGTNGSNPRAARWRPDAGWQLTSVPLLGGTAPMRALAEFDGGLYAVGGMGGAAALAYRPATAGWVDVPVETGDAGAPNGLAAIVVFGGELLAAGEDAHLMRYGPSGWQRHPQFGLQGIDPRRLGIDSLVDDGQSRLIAGTGFQQLWALAPDAGAVFPEFAVYGPGCTSAPWCRVPQRTLGIARVADGSLWAVGTGGRLYRLSASEPWRSYGAGGVFDLHSIWGAPGRSVVAVGGAPRGSDAFHIVRTAGFWGTAMRDGDHPWFRVRGDAQGVVASAGLNGQWALNFTNSGCAGQGCSGRLSAVAGLERGGWVFGGDQGHFVINADAGVVGNGAVRVSDISPDGPEAPLAVGLDGALYAFDAGYAVSFLQLTYRGEPDNFWAVSGTRADWVAAGVGIYANQSAALGPGVVPQGISWKTVRGQPGQTWWAAGDRGTLIHCEQLRCETEIVGTHHTLHGLWEVQGLGLFVVGENGTVLRRQ